MLTSPSFGVLQALAVVEHELLLFAAFWFAVGAVDELLVDGLWLWLRISGRARTARLQADRRDELAGIAAVLVPAWRESAVIGAMVRHCLESWPQRGLRLYVGVYRNDEPTLAVLTALGCDPRLRVVLHDRDGPTTKADCLNRLYRAMCDDEDRTGERARCLILHDAEDMVHPAALSLMDEAIGRADLVQLPVRAEPQGLSPWIAGHYCDEFAEAHAKDMVVRNWLGAGLPSAGVGCAFSRRAIDRILARRGGADPFAAECLTEDYEAGLLVSETGGEALFLRVRDRHGVLVATREFFPATLATSVRQKTRWLHGIAFQGWDRLGWSGQPCDLWMRVRDRRGPMVALVLTAAYSLVALWPVVRIAEVAGAIAPVPADPVVKGLLSINLLSFLWRLLLRFCFTTREFGWVEGLRSIFRFPVGNVIAIMAGRRAFLAYLRVLLGGKVRWEHTIHLAHPAALCRLTARASQPATARG